MTFYIKERIENISRRKGQVGAETEERKKRMGKVREDGKESPLCRTIFQYLW